MTRKTCLFAALLTLSINLNYRLARGDEATLVQEVTHAMRRAAVYCRERVARHGGYVYFYSLDLKDRWGEGLAREDEIWVQPPGTPTVGLAYLKAYEATGDPYYRDAAQEAAEALVFGQLHSGGWSNAIDLKSRAGGAKFRGGATRREGATSLDDGQTQSAIRLLIQMDKALGFRHEDIHSAVLFALDALLASQFPNGGFPQGWKAPVSEQPVLRASYPDYDWRTEGRIKNYWDMYTINDNVSGYVADALIDAHQVYGDAKYLASLRQLGDFLILAQMPDPQPGWAQQYNYAMKPIWARKFEPPALASDESQEVLETLIVIYQVTGDRKYLQPIPRALAWLERSTLSDGKLARYYELKTNRPLYMTRKYTLTYDDADLPSHYGWKIDSRLDDIKRLYAESTEIIPPATSGTRLADLAHQSREIIGLLDEEGRWITAYQGGPLVGQPKILPGTRFLSSEIFSRNLTALSEFLIAAARR